MNLVGTAVGGSVGAAVGASDEQQQATQSALQLATMSELHLATMSEQMLATLSSLQWRQSWRLTTLLVKANQAQLMCALWPEVKHEQDLVQQPW